MDEHEHATHGPTPTDRICDVAIIGGGAAGLAAGLQLARSRRSVLVIDAGAPRNAPAAHMHGYLGHDGRPPGEFLAIGREEVRRYGGGVLDGTVTSVHSHGGTQFRLVLEDGTTVSSRRIVLATGLVDQLPDIPGVREQWGRGVLHCPYCHGWEVREQAIVVIGTGPMAAHQALLFRQLSENVTVVVHEGDGPTTDDQPRLDAMGIDVVEARVAEVAIDADDEVVGVHLDDGRMIAADAVVVAPRFVGRTELLGELGLSPVEAPMGTGEMIAVDERGATEAPGVYAAGNVADVSAQVLQAAAQGSRVGAMVNFDLVHEDAERATAPIRGGALQGDSAEDWDDRYGSEEQFFSGAVNGALAAEATSLSPGRALDVGCGEGADAIWLAARGWEVTGLDISQLALDRARATADAAGVEVSWEQADVAVDPPKPEAYDLVSVFYPALRHSEDDAAIRALIDAVAPGGTLLVVGHDVDSMKHHHVGFDPDDYVQPPDVAGRLGDDWTIEVDEVRERIRPPGHDGPDIPDRVLRARRSP